MSARLTRRAALALPAALLAGCSVFDDLFGDSKPPLPGKREAIATGRGGLVADTSDTRPVALPPPAANPDWPQAGNTPTHVGGNLAARGLARAWSVSIGESAGYRRKITAQPVAAGGRVFSMDPDGVVTAYDLGSGARLWRTTTRAKKDRSSNVGGGLAVAGDTLYAATGRAELLALDPASGTIRWRKPLGAPARAAPTVAEGRVFVPTLDARLLALSAQTGEREWDHQANTAQTSVLGEPSPAVASGVVVAGFGSGELVALRAESGAVIWSDSLAAARGRTSLLDLSSIRARPVIDRNRVFATSLGGITASLDLRTGRRLWEREAGGSEMPWVAGDWVFLLSADQQLAAIGRDDGRVRWVADLPAYEDPEKRTGPYYWTGPVLVEGRLIVAGGDERLLAIDAARGKLVGEQPLPATVSVAPALAAGTLLVVTDDGSLIAFR